MTQRSIILSWLIPVAVCAFTSAPAEAAEINRAAEIQAYGETTARLNRLIKQTASSASIDDALQAVIEPSAKQGQAEMSVASVRAVLTNLFLLEKGLQETSIATNTTVRPPAWPSTFSGASIDSIKDPEERQATVAYRAAVRAATELWNLHQALVRAYLRNGQKAINFVVEAQQRGSLTATQMTELLKPYRGSGLATKLEERLAGPKK